MQGFLALRAFISALRAQYLREFCKYVHVVGDGGILCGHGGDEMFNDNWYLFLLIVMLAFFADGEINSREATVMLFILFALTLTNSSEGTATTSCFCNKGAQN